MEYYSTLRAFSINFQSTCLQRITLNFNSNLVVLRRHGWGRMVDSSFVPSLTSTLSSPCSWLSVTGLHDYHVWSTISQPQLGHQDCLTVRVMRENENISTQDYHHHVCWILKLIDDQENGQFWVKSWYCSFEWGGIKFLFSFFLVRT